MTGIIGQEHAVGRLRSALGAGRLHHALVFHGPEGVGKFTTAVALARVLLCLEPAADDGGATTACGRCASCRLMTATDQSTHPDFQVVTKELARYSDDAAVRQRKLTTIPVDVLRRYLIEPVYRAPGLGRGKVFIVDEAHLLDPVGQNLLLKTLEEPPAATHIILVTASESRLLPTIRSRCHRVPFAPLGEGEVRAWAARPPGAPQGAAMDWLVRFADGSLGRAEVAMRYGLAGWAEVIGPAIEAMARGAFPEDLGAQMAQMIDGFAKQWVQEHANASKEAANQRAAGLLWGIVGLEARDRIAGAAAMPVGGSAEELGEAVGPWLGVIDALSIAERELSGHVNTGLVTDHLASLVHRCVSRGDRPLMPLA